MTGNFNTIVLVAPLDWGLGHATRCIPLIRYLSEKGCKVLVAAEGKQMQILQVEFPDLQFLNLKGYRIQYARNKRLFAIKIMCQLPKIFLAIRSEHKWLKTIVKMHNIAAIVSDNRYGLWHRKITSIFITHQLQVKAPLIAERWIQRSLYRYINRFSACWVPDVEVTPNIAGGLSHPKIFPKVPVKYLGGLSRFDDKEGVRIKYDLLAVISGPEPQRSALEQNLLKSVINLNLKVLFVRGLPGTAEQLSSSANVTIVNHLPAQEMNMAFQQSDFIVSRSGYTTVMDILRLRKKSILIPTPGQSEQEYLAIHLKNERWCYTVPQHHLNLDNALKEAKAFDYQFPEITMLEYKKVLDEFLSSIGHTSDSSATFAPITFDN